MHEPLTYLNGKFIPAAQAAISPIDTGFVQGAAVAEQLRSFHGKLFHVEDHVARLGVSLRLLDLDLGLTLDRLAAIAKELCVHNHAILAAGDDLGLSIVVTPGPYAGYGGQVPASPTVCLHTYPLPFSSWAEKYRTGQSLVTTAVQQVPWRCWPPEVKCRSRMHYYLADRQAAAIEPGARAVLLDQEGFVTEASTANLLAYRAAEGLLSPPLDRVLRGISLTVLSELAAEKDIPMVQRPLTPADLVTSDELLLSSTPFCLLPVTRFNGRAVGDGRPGRIFEQLIAGWSERVGVDIVAQAQQFATRR
jgi:branched-subunit amino acid aminotransferase/4-amino-4-deoxychorismate lyase